MIYYILISFIIILLSIFIYLKVKNNKNGDSGGNNDKPKKPLYSWSDDNMNEFYDYITEQINSGTFEMPKSSDKSATTPNSKYVLTYKNKECLKQKISNQLSYDNFKLFIDNISGKDIPTKKLSDVDNFNFLLILNGIILGSCIEKYSWENYPKDNKTRIDHLFYKMDETYGFDLTKPNIVNCLFKNISTKYNYEEYTLLGLFTFIVKYKDDKLLKNYKLLEDYDNYMKSLNKICYV